MFFKKPTKKQKENIWTLFPKKQSMPPRRIPPITMLVIADLHSCWWETMRDLINIAEKGDYDCVLLLGDIYAEDIRTLIPHLKGRPCLYILGNHDTWNQNEGIKGTFPLDGKTAIIKGVRFSGASGGPRYKDGDFAMRTEEEMEDVLKNLKKTDVLVSHESPYHLLNPNKAHSGFQAITDFLTEREVPLHIFGHHHIDHEEVVGRTREVCVYGCSLIRTEPFETQKLL